MSRRIFSIVLFLTFLTLSLALSLKPTFAQAITATPTRTPTIIPPTRTSTSVPGADFVGTPLSGAAPLSVQFTHINTSVLSNCTWTFGDGTSQFYAPPSGTFGSCPSVTHVYASAGSYTVSLRVTKATNSFTNTMTKTNYIQVTGSTVLTPTPTQDPCATATYTIFGRVYDAANPSVGIANATIFTTTDIGAAPNTTTGPDGSYSLPIDNPYHGCHILGLSVFANGYQSVSQAIHWQDLKAQPERNFGLVAVSNTATSTRTPPTLPAHTYTPVITNTRTPGECCPPTYTPTRTRTPSPTRSPGTPVQNTPTRTPTPGSGTACSPVNAIISAPFSFDNNGIARSLCWQSNNLGSFINSWNTTSVTVNGVNFTNIWVPSSSYPAQIGGYWYINYNGTAWGHFEAKP